MAERASALHTNAEAAIDEDAVYAVIAEELEGGKTDKGLWTRLYAQNDGDERNTKVAYIRHRADKLIAAERNRVTRLAEAEASLATEAQELASSAAVSVEQAREMIVLGVKKVGDKFVYGEYRYDHLTDAVNYARASERNKGG